MRARHLAGLLGLCLLVSCASNGTPPRGNPADDADASRADDDAPSAEDARIPDSRQPTEEELAAAFEPPRAPSTHPGGLSGTGQVVHPPPPGDPDAPRRQAFDAEEKRIRGLLSVRAWEEAFAAAERLESMASGLGHGYRRRAVLLQLEAAMRLRDKARRARVALRFAALCGPDGVKGCRHHALRHAGRTPAAEAVREADACVRKANAAAQKGPSALPDCLGAAMRTYRAQRDGLMQARIAWVKARALLADPSRREAGVRAAERAVDVCTEPRCVLLRRDILRHLVFLYLEDAQDPARAARAAIRGMALYAESLPPAERPWAWTKEMDAACAALDEVEGDGACRRLEQRLTGRLTFRDFSRGPAVGEGLSPELVRQVNAHYWVTLQPCLADEAARLRPPAQERYTVRWVVLNDGRVGELHMDRREREDAPLARCLRERIALWRYPKYSGEYQHVEQTFLVSARRKR